MNFFTIRLSKDIDDFLKKLLLQEEKTVIIQDLNQNFNYIGDDSIFLLYVKGGATASEWWIKDPDYRGTLFIATLNKKPEYYDKKNFKVEVNIRYRFKHPVTQEMCKYYPDTYNTELGPKTKGSQTQAISFLQDEKQVLGILRAALYYNPDAETFYREFFGDNFLNKIKSSMKRFVEKDMDYETEQQIKTAVQITGTNNLSKEKNRFSHNRIIFGAPGTGKSHQLDSDLKDKEGNDYFKYYERVTFHPSYSYANFVGTYKPVKDEKGNGQITYEFVEGPFIRVLRQALCDKENNNYLLIIEEINRANVTAVFGDVFQLLDRDSENVSQYEVAASEDLRKHLLKEGVPAEKAVVLRIPANMYVWASMNSADQGVQPLDTAFKRRWDFEYLNINEGEKSDTFQDFEIIQSAENKMSWNKLRHLINSRLSSNYNINEDKLLGPFFIRKGKKSEEQLIKTFKSKVLMYLFEDVCKINPKPLFAGIDKPKLYFSDVAKFFDEKGFSIFKFSEDEIKKTEEEIEEK